MTHLLLVDIRPLHCAAYDGTRRMDRVRGPTVSEHSVPGTSGDVGYDACVLDHEAPRSQRLVALTVAAFAGTAICAGWIAVAIAGLVKGKPTPAGKGIVLALVAFALIRAAALALAGVAYLKAHRRARMFGATWAVLALVDAGAALLVLGAPLLAVVAGAVVPLATLVVLFAAPPPELAA
jgi:hypothetical protein